MDEFDFSTHAKKLSKEVVTATAGSRNEANLRHEIEKVLEAHCKKLSIPWVPFTFETALKPKDKKHKKFADVIHGSMVIEYEPPASFSGKQGKKLTHARKQAEEYAFLLHQEEGRDLGSYILIAWDGSHITFGKYREGKPAWEKLSKFDAPQAEKLLRLLAEEGTPLVHPLLLKSLVGPESEIGSETILRLYRAVQISCSEQNGETNKTNLLFTEWKRLFSQVAGSQTLKIKKLLATQEQAHGENFSNHVPEYLFALNTYIAIVAKIVAALSLPNVGQNITDINVGVRRRLSAIESGDLFENAGIIGMLAADFFSWYLDDPSWNTYECHVDSLLIRLSTADYDIAKKSPSATRDLFKGIYESFVPKAIRHSLGEYYTPDWLAEHIVDKTAWKEEDSFLDPTCGTGTFLIEALKRRLAKWKGQSRHPMEYLERLYGIDLNPLAVITARASIVVFLSPYLDPENPVRIPVFLADAINPASLSGDCYEHTLQTEFGEKLFKIPERLVAHPEFFSIFARVRELVIANIKLERIIQVLKKEYNISAILDSNDAREAIFETLSNLAELHENGWDGIWCNILADRFAASAIPKVDYIAGNPPWVKWSNLPKEYAEFIKPHCAELGLFSEDNWVGGIESDISIVVTYKVIQKWLANNGILGFLITGTVFANESSQGFRQFNLPEGSMPLKVLSVEDFKAIKPFENTATHPAFMLMKKGDETEYPLPYTYWEKSSNTKKYTSAKDFYSHATPSIVYAVPIPGKDAGPWLRGNRDNHRFWKKLFGGEERYYKARKGITTDLNGVYFVKVLERLESGKVRVVNDVSAGKMQELPEVKAIIEDVHVFPLLRGKGVQAFSAEIDPVHHVIIPQRGMHGDPELPINAPYTYKFLMNFEKFIKNRSSYKRFQRGKAPWSVWSTGEYTFCNYKVLWKEMSGKNFSAAYVSNAESPELGTKVIIPDHKLYFVPLESEDEAAFLTGFLNAPLVVNGVVSYSECLLSLGASVVEYLNIPKYDSTNLVHRNISGLAKQAHQAVEGEQKKILKALDENVQELLK